MSYVFLMRHADRDGMPGFDDPINDAGRARAQTIEWNCDLAIVSPLRRTTQTLEASRVKYRYKIQSGLCRERRAAQLPARREPPTGDERRVRHATRRFPRLPARADESAFASILVVTHGVFMGRFLQSGNGIGYCECRRWQP